MTINKNETRRPDVPEVTSTSSGVSLLDDLVTWGFDKLGRVASAISGQGDEYTTITMNNVGMMAEAETRFLGAVREAETLARRGTERLDDAVVALQSAADFWQQSNNQLSRVECARAEEVKIPRRVLRAAETRAPLTMGPRRDRENLLRSANMVVAYTALQAAKDQHPSSYNALAITLTDPLSSVNSRSSARKLGREAEYVALAEVAVARLACVEQGDAKAYIASINQFVEDERIANGTDLQFERREPYCDLRRTMNEVGETPREAAENIGKHMAKFADQGTKVDLVVVDNTAASYFAKKQGSVAARLTDLGVKHTPDFHDQLRSVSGDELKEFGKALSSTEVVYATRGVD